MSILEAMASGTPVLITPGCNFPEAIRSGAAIEVEPDVGSTSHGLHEILASSAERLSDMGHRGRELIRKGFTWDSVAEQTLHLYRWLKGQDSKPEFVET